LVFYYTVRVASWINCGCFILNFLQVFSFRSTETVPCSSECNSGSSTGRGISIYLTICKWCGSYTAAGWCTALHGTSPEGTLCFGPTMSHK